MTPPTSPKKLTKQPEAITLLERLTQLLSQPLPGLTQQVLTPPVSNPVPAHDAGIPPIYVRLNGQNYGLWVQVVEMQLASKDKTGYIDGSLPPPLPSDALYKKWKVEDSTVKGWLINSMDPALISNFIRFPSAREVWKAVTTSYSDGNDKSQVYNLKRKVARLKQSGKPIEEYYNMLQELWQEIDFRRPNPMQYTADIEKYNSIVQEDRVYIFLDGLDDHLDNIRADVIRMNPFPSVEEAFSRIRQEEKRQCVMLNKEETNTPMAMLVRDERRLKANDTIEANLTRPKQNQGYPRPFTPGGCTHCGGAKHTKENCIKLKGYPDWYKELKKKRQQTSGGSTGTAALASGGNVSLVPLIDGERVQSAEGYPHEGDYWAW